MAFENDFGRAVSRILSAQPLVKPASARRLYQGLGRESFVSAASTRNPFRFRETWSGQLQGPLFGLAPDGVFRASALTLGAVGSYPTFSPLPRFMKIMRRGGLFSVALSVRMPHGIASRVYPKSWLQVTRHRALRCSDFPPPPSCLGESDSPPFQNRA